MVISLWGSSFIGWENRLDSATSLWPPYAVLSQARFLIILRPPLLTSESVFNFFHPLLRFPFIVLSITVINISFPLPSLQVCIKKWSVFFVEVVCFLCFLCWSPLPLHCLLYRYIIFSQIITTLTFKKPLNPITTDGWGEVYTSFPFKHTLQLSLILFVAEFFTYSFIFTSSEVFQSTKN